MPKRKIVAATGAATGTLSKDSGAKERATAIEAAMLKAIEDANAKGITDPEKIRELMQKAREQAR